MKCLGSGERAAVQRRAPARALALARHRRRGRGEVALSSRDVSADVGHVRAAAALPPARSCRAEAGLRVLRQRARALVGAGSAGAPAAAISAAAVPAVISRSSPADQRGPGDTAGGRLARGRGPGGHRRDRGAVFAMTSRGRGDAGALPGGGGAVPAGEHLQWSSNGTSVLPARIDGDNIEDFVGRYVILDIDRDSSQTLFVGGFSGATFERAWKAGPYGTLSEGSARRTWPWPATASPSPITAWRCTCSTRRQARSYGVCASAIARGACAPRRTRASRCGSRWSTATAWSSTSRRAKQSRWPNARPGAAAARATSARGRAPRAAMIATALPSRLVLAPIWSSPTAARQSRWATKSRGRARPWRWGSTRSGASPRGRRRSGGSDLRVGDARPFRRSGGGAVLHHVLAGQPEGQSAGVVRRALRRAPLGRGGAPRLGRIGRRGLTATATRVYAPHWTWLDVFDAGSGKHLGTVGIW